jgi:hypothetical protein
MWKSATARLLVALVALAVWPVRAQLPASGTLSAADWPLFRAEVERVEKQLASAPDKATVTYELARTWASAKQWPETVQWLNSVAEMKAGLDPSRDSVFGELRGTREFAQVLASVRDATPAVSHSRAVFRITEGDLVPESMAYDPRASRFYFGSMKKGKVVRCTASGECEIFVSGLGEVLGLKVRDDGLWLLNNSAGESSLMHYDPASRRLIQKYSVMGARHEFNDLALATSGDVYLTDTPAGTVWRLANGAADLERIPGSFQFANGIALSPDGRFLYVSTFPDGLRLVDLLTYTNGPLARPAGLCLATIDGLYFHRGALIAIQNGIMSPRVVRLVLTRERRAIERFEVLERRNPLFEGVTTGVVAGRDFFYMANIQDDKKTGFDPITILKLRL